MGCDIHLVLERRHNDKWIGVNAFEGHHDLYAGPDARMDGWSMPVARSRNYVRFAELAGVRGDGPEARGVPEDASDLSRMLIEQWGSDGHSHSWLWAGDAAAIFLRTTQKKVSDYQQKYPESYFFGIEDKTALPEYRLVFWFDN